MTHPDASSPNVFLSWSLDRSKAVASALRGWLPRVIQACEPWMSAEDIHAGKRWRREVAHHLGALKIGVLCLTPENVERPWINFEAGALSRSVADDSHVIPYCFGLGPADYGDPLGDFNGVKADREGTLKLVRAINAAMTKPLKDVDLDHIVDRMWGDLETDLGKIEVTRQGPTAPVRPDRDLIEEILTRVRELDLTPGFVGPAFRLTADGSRVVRTEAYDALFKGLDGRPDEPYRKGLEILANLPGLENLAKVARPEEAKGANPAEPDVPKGPAK